ncbi:MAG: hypothetical protein J6K17_07565 [Oscillospiraceae bacterium]|nr:hypothetical protein [Oscillospiraceae bacterium]
MKVNFYKDITEDDVRKAFGDKVLDNDTVISYGKYKEINIKDILTNLLCIILCIPMAMLFGILGIQRGGPEIAGTSWFFTGLFLFGIILSISKLVKNFSPVYYICTNRFIAAKNSAAIKPKIYLAEDILCLVYNNEKVPEKIYVCKKINPFVLFFLCYVEDAAGICAEYHDLHRIEYYDEELIKKENYEKKR